MKRLEMLRWLSPLLATFLLTQANPVQSQSVIQVSETKLRPQINRDERGFVSCGIHIVALDSSGPGIEVYDFSLYFYPDNLTGLVKVGKWRPSRQESLAGKLPSKAVTPAPTGFWIAKENEGVPLQTKKVIAAEAPGFIIAGMDLVKSYELILAIIHGERMHFSARYQDQKIDAIIAFGSPLPDQERDPLLACLNGAIGRLRGSSSGSHQSN